jgi:hypothetical protein
MMLTKVSYLPHPHVLLITFGKMSDDDDNDSGHVEEPTAYADALEYQGSHFLPTGQDIYT